MRISGLREQINRTLSGPLLAPETVIGACSQLSVELRSGRHDGLIRRIVTGGDEEIGQELLQERVLAAAGILDASFLEHKYKLELGADAYSPRRFPLGVLLHIGAGNMDALSAYSVVEGLLAGNINLLKLPEEERGISGALLGRLVKICPSLRPYIHVYSIPSSDVRRMKLLAGLADGIAVWGGDPAVAAVRRLAKPSTKIVEWGHKLSFVYVSGEAKAGALDSLARHILDTAQLLCSSCQGVYLDTEDWEETVELGRRLLAALEEEIKRRPEKGLGYRAKNTLRVLNSRLEAAAFGGRLMLCGENVSVAVTKAPGLEQSLMFGSCWVKQLPRRKIMSVLRENSGYLQTVGLICKEEDREELSYLFWRAGAVRTCEPGQMSALHGTQPHDGEYPLRRYSKIVSGR